MPYQIVLRACPEDAQAATADALSRAFGIKESTSATVVQSTPIVILDDLTEVEAAAMSLALCSIELAGGVLEIVTEETEELPKIDWPKRPKIFKRSVSTYPSEYAMSLPVGNDQHRLIDLLVARLNGPDPADSGAYQPQEVEPAEARGHNSSSRQEFVGSDLGEITPFSNPILPSAPSTPPARQTSSVFARPPSGPQPRQPGTGSIADRMDELFPDESENASIVPSSQDITNIIDQLLPDEQGAQVHPGGSSSLVKQGTTGAHGGTGNFSLFLNKITDQSRREKAVPLLVELIGISAEEAEGLAKKMIIPVLKNVSKQEAETAKHRFAEIGVLARIRS